MSNTMTSFCCSAYLKRPDCQFFFSRTIITMSLCIIQVIIMQQKSDNEIKNYSEDFNHFWKQLFLLIIAKNMNFQFVGSKSFENIHQTCTKLIS